MILKILNYLKQPYPCEYKIQHSIRMAVGTGLFIFLFLFIFQPFGLDNLNPVNKPFIILGYGIITFLVVFIFQLVLPKIFPRIFAEENWKVLHEILQISLTILAIGLGNTLYTCGLGIARLSPDSIIIFQIYTLLIGIFPISFTVAFRQYLLLKKNLKSACELNQQVQKAKETPQANQPDVQTLTISDENEKETISTKIADLLFVKSVGNYVEVYCADRDRIKKILLRSTLARIENKLTSYNFIVRCHRTYLINLKNIQNVTGNSQGYRLLVRNSDIEIPVARSYAKNLQQAVAQSH